MSKNKEYTIREIYDTSKKEGIVGIEVEIEGAGLPVETGNNWVPTRDGSLRGEGLEYVLNKPVSVGRVLPVLDELDKYLSRASKIEPSDRCGVHVHINCQQDTCKEVYKFCMLYYVFENLLMRYCGEDREGNMFCLRLKDASYSISEWRKVAKSLNSRDNPLSPLMGSSIKYGSLNPLALSRYGSIEFRGLRTPRRMIDIEPWVKMLLKIKEASKSFNEAQEIVENFSMSGVERFMQDVLGEYVELLHCPGEQEMLFGGVRQIQDIVYTPADKKTERKNKAVEKEDTFWINDQPVRRVRMGRAIEDAERGAAPNIPVPDRNGYVHRDRHGLTWVSLHGHWIPIADYDIQMRQRRR